MPNPARSRLAPAAFHGQKGPRRPDPPPGSGESLAAPPEPRRLRGWVMLSLTLVLTAVVFWPSFSNALLNFDDPANISRNPFIRHLTPATLRAYFTTPLMGMYTPLVYLSYALDYKLGGLDVTIYHATNLLLHLLNVVLVWFVVRALAGNAFVPVIVAALFAVHPANVAAVVPLSVRSSLLYASFYLAAYLAYLSYVRTGRRRRLAASFALFVLALLSKSAAVVFPLLLVLTDFRCGRIRSRTALLEKVPFLVTSIVFGTIGLAIREDVAAMGGALPYSEADRALVALYGLAFYAGKTILPVGLSAFYTYPEKVGGHLPVAIYLAPIALAAFAVLVVRSAAWRSRLAFGSLFFLIHIVLVLKFVPLGVEFAADRYLYLPSIGVFLVAAESWRQSGGTVRKIGLACLVLVTVVFSVVSYGRCGDWKDSKTFYARILAREPRNAFAQNNLGRVLGSEDQLVEAESHFREAVRLAPTYILPRLNLAEALAAQGKGDEAIGEFEALLELDPANARAHAGLGLALAQAGRIMEAVAHLEQSVRLDPTTAATHTNLGAALASLGRHDEAIAHYREALAIDGGAEAHNNLGAAFAALGRLEEAAAEFTAAIRLDPRASSAHRNLGLVRARQQREDDAILEFLEALRLDGRLADVHFNVAVLLIKRGRREEARGHLQTVLELAPGDEAARRLLAGLSSPSAR